MTSELNAGHAPQGAARRTPVPRAPLGTDALTPAAARAVAQLLSTALALAHQRGLTALEPPAVPPAGIPRDRLSAREREVLQRIAAGDTNTAIARDLALSPYTVKRHLANILDKLDARTRAHAAACTRMKH